MKEEGERGRVASELAEAVMEGMSEGLVEMERMGEGDSPPVLEGDGEGKSVAVMPKEEEAQLEGGGDRDATVGVGVGVVAVVGVKRVAEGESVG